MVASLVESGYVLVFGLAAIACFASLLRTRVLDDSATKRGLVGLLVTSGLWAAAQVGRLVVDNPELKITFYLLGLTVGLATVGAWLYFCSAYTGRDYHERPVVRQLALGIYLTIVAVKLTNPLHQQYFTTSFSTTSYPQLVIELSPLHWGVTGVAYTLSAVGFYFLYQLFRESRYNTTSLNVLVAIAGLAAPLSALGHVIPARIAELNYEPIGVALFAIGVLFFVEEKFVAVPTFGHRQVIENLQEPILLLDRDGVLHDYNAAAAAQFPAIDGRRGSRLDEIAPSLLAAVETDDSVTTVPDTGSDEDDVRYYLAETTPLTVGSVTIGRALVFTDVTDLERQRQELQRQNEQLDDFAAAITHELRNTLSIAQGYLTQVSTTLTADTDPTTMEALATADDAVNRMSRIVDDLSVLARHGQTLDERAECDLADVAKRAWAAMETDGMTLTTGETRAVAADPGRLEALFTDVFEFARATDATEVVVTTHSDGFAVTTDGQPVPAENAEQAFEYGSAVPTAEAGMALPNVRALARVHGWTASLDTSYTDGVRLLIGDAD